jgi:hypothetical protein
MVGNMLVEGGIPDIIVKNWGILDISKNMGGKLDICRKIKHRTPHNAD